MQRRKQRKGKAKPRKNAPRGAMDRKAHDHHLRSLEDLKKPKLRLIGPTQTIPSWRFPKYTEYWSQNLVIGSSFQVHTGLTGDNIQGAAAAFGGSFAFAIGDIADIASLQQVFDEFLLYRVVVTIRARAPSTVAPAQLYVIVDYDDSTAPASLQATTANQYCQEVRCQLTPNIGDSIVVDTELTHTISAAAGTIVVPATWQNVATTSNSHFGVKFWYQTTAVTDGSWRVDAMYYYGFRNTQ